MIDQAAGLLPDGDDAVRCSVHAREHRYDPGGSAISASAIILLEVPLPWPKPVFDHAMLAGLTAKMSTPAGEVRLLAMVPEQPGRLRVRRFDRAGAGALEATFEDVRPAELAATVCDVASIASPPERARALARPTVLVCTQGTHDVCCGIEGTRLAMELGRQPDLTVHRVSHTGGHRFAPTAMTLPDGRMWAHLDTDTLRAISRHGIPASQAARHCRGWWGAPPGAGQVAERAVFAEVGWSWERVERTIEPTGDAQIWNVTGDGRTWLVRTAPVRSVPVLACRAPGGTPAKTAVEYDATIVRRP